MSHEAMGVPLALWSAEAVATWVNSLGDSLAPYAERFREADVDGELLSLLTDDDLAQDIAIVAPLHRRRILAEVSRLSGGGLASGSLASGGLASHGSSLNNDGEPTPQIMRAPPAVVSAPWLARVDSHPNGDEAAQQADQQAWLCCETDAGQLYYHNTVANVSTYSPAHVPPSILPPSVRPADQTAPPGPSPGPAGDDWVDASSLILVSDLRFGRLSERMAAGRRPTPASALPTAPGQLKDGEPPAWALAEPPPLGSSSSSSSKDRGGGAPIQTIQAPFEPLSLKADPTYSLPAAVPLVPRDKVDLSRHTAHVAVNERTSIFTTAALVEERYLHALKPAIMTHLAAVAGPFPYAGNADDVMRWCEGKQPMPQPQGMGPTDGSASASDQSVDDRVELLEELYGNLAPALHDAPWLQSTAAGPNGLTPSQEGITGLPIALRQSLQTNLSLRSSSSATHGGIGGGRLGGTASSYAEVARAFVEEFENVSSTLLSGAEQARLAKLRRARHAAALEIQRMSRGCKYYYTHTCIYKCNLLLLQHLLLTDWC